MEKRVLSRDEVTCPICYSFIVDPVTFPCKHNVCWHCYDRHINMTSIYCPVCRYRLSVWARNTAKTNSYVNLQLKELIERQFPGPFEAQQRRLEAEAEGVKTEEADDEVLADFMKEETPPVMDRIFAEPGEIAREFGWLCSRYQEELEKEKAEAERAWESFISENYTDYELKILLEMEENLVNQSDEGERPMSNRKHRRSARLAAKDDTQKLRLQNKSPPAMPVKTTPSISQNSRQTNGNGEQGEPYKSVPTPTKAVSQKKKALRRSGRLAGTPKPCLFCGNKPPTGSQMGGKNSPCVSQNSPHTSTNDKQGTSSKSVPTSTKGTKKFHRRSARLAAKAGSGSQQKCCSFCGNEPPAGSRIRRKIAPHVSQNSPQTNGNGKRETSSKTISRSTKGVSQKQKCRSANEGVGVLGGEIVKARDESIPCSSSSLYAQLNPKTSPIDSKRALENSTPPKIDSAKAKASQPLTISAEQECQAGVSVTFNVRSDIFVAKDHHNNKENVIPPTKRQYPSKAVTPNAVTKVSEQKGKKAMMVLHDHSELQTAKQRNGCRRIEDLRSKQEAKDRRIAKMLQNLCRYDYEAPRLRPRKST